MADEPKRRAQEALYAAIEGQAGANMKAAMSATEKAALLRDLAQAYRLTAGGSMPAGTGGAGEPARRAARPRKSSASSRRRGRPDR